MSKKIDIAQFYTRNGKRITIYNDGSCELDITLLSDIAHGNLEEIGFIREWLYETKSFIKKQKEIDILRIKVKRSLSKLSINNK